MDLLWAEYGGKLPDILALPVDQALCLQAAIYQRHDVKINYPTFTERDILEQIAHVSSPPTTIY